MSIGGRQFNHQKDQLMTVKKWCQRNFLLGAFGRTLRLSALQIIYRDRHHTCKD